MGQMRVLKIRPNTSRGSGTKHFKGAAPWLISLFILTNFGTDPCILFLIVCGFPTKLLSVSAKIVQQLSLCVGEM